eukprot:TRINITY_DN50269_c0_g1_i1.p1 TRINITY_DN50269_c0_g1~~TRINITY_DN50269_c0_g1_i1.p1  ORF type:complete len:208 (+),score=32.93 TRINITY_DN50269_c0_g1_i1:81-704(+)
MMDKGCSSRQLDVSQSTDKEPRRGGESEFLLDIVVSKLSGEPLANVESFGSSTVWDLTQLISEVAGIDGGFCGVQLLHGDKTMDLDTSLAEAGFQPGTPVHLIAILDEYPTFEITVLADDHVHGPLEKSMFFHFAREAVVGLEKEGVMLGNLVNSRTGERGDATLWGRANGGSFGDAHGRFGPCSARRFGQFQPGDLLFFTKTETQV